MKELDVVKLPVLYTPKQVAESGAFSPSAAKPAQLVAAWRASGFPIDVIDPTPCTERDMCRAHAPEYVDGVLSGRLRNGFGNRRSDVILSLPWTTGSMLSAARYALAHPEAPAPCSPSSGFHHAGYDFGGGFCTLNGLMIAALTLLDEGLVKRVGILDLDQHYGNGTDNILGVRGARPGPRSGRPTYRADVATGAVLHFTGGKNYSSRTQAARFLSKELPEIVDDMARSCGVVLYQAGADPHVDDPLGGWLTTDQLAERDRIVFEGCRCFGTPVAWNLAGGYSRDKDGGIPVVLEVHTNTAKAALDAALRGR